jgi:hypothetical protein
LNLVMVSSTAECHLCGAVIGYISRKHTPVAFDYDDPDEASIVDGYVADGGVAVAAFRPYTRLNRDLDAPELVAEWPE